jgi:hypothetical protein
MGMRGESSLACGGSSFRPFPHFLLACGALAGLFGGGVLGNHGLLVDGASIPWTLADYHQPLDLYSCPIDIHRQALCGGWEMSWSIRLA